jgi:hypothetical protein
MMTREDVKAIPSSEVNKDYRMILLPSREGGMFWLNGYLLGTGNVAVFSSANNSPHVLATTTPDQHVKPKTFIPPPPSGKALGNFVENAASILGPKLEVQRLISDPRTYREKGNDSP